MDIEQKIISLGKSLFIKADHKDNFFNKNIWIGKMMDWVMKNPDLKIDLFRLVDVLPVLSSNEQIAKHVKEYLLNDKPNNIFINTALKAAVLPLTQGLAAKTIKNNVTDMAKRFIAGEDINDAKETLTILSNKGFCFTIDLLGEKTLSDAEADIYLKRYLHLLSFLPQILPNQINDLNVSIKISALSCNLLEQDIAFSITDLSKRVIPILRLAKANNIAVNFDVEQWQSHEICYELFNKIVLSEEFRSWPLIGIVIQAYLKSSLSITENIIKIAQIRHCPLMVRLVKGAYWDYEVIKAKQHGHEPPVFLQKAETDINYEKLTRLLLNNSQLIKPAFASHNIRSLAHAIIYAQEINNNNYEIQMLHGMAEAEKIALLSNQKKIRLYIPLGDILPGMSYLVRRLLENTSQMSFLKMSHHDQKDHDILLASPVIIKNQTINETSEFTNIASIDFVSHKERKLFLDSIEKTNFPIKVPVIISNQVKICSRTKDHICPSNNNIITTIVSLAEPIHVDEALKSCLISFAELNNLSLSIRANHLRNLADILLKDRYILAALICYEVGKTWEEADADVCEAIDFCNFYALSAEKNLTEKNLTSLPGENNKLSYHGRGPAVIIAPWNFPLAIICGMSVAAYVSGNPIILKPAEQASLTAYLLYQRMIDAGFMKDAVHFLPGIGEEIGPLLVKHPETAIVCFTGSQEVGQKICNLANIPINNQKEMKKVICEMGGKNAVIIDDDADLDEAVFGIIKSGFAYAGQKCSAASRVITIGNIKEDLIKRLKDACSSLILGPSYEAKTFIGPVIDDKSYERLSKIIEDCRNDNKVSILYEGQTCSGGFFISPLLIEVFDKYHYLMQEELFGPIIAMFHVKDIKDAVLIANSTKYALTGALFSRSPANINFAQKNWHVGNLYINQKCTGAKVCRQPFGGFKMSGTGIKAGGDDYLYHFVNSKTISENTMRRGFSPEISI